MSGACNGTEAERKENPLLAWHLQETFRTGRAKLGLEAMCGFKQAVPGLILQTTL